MSLISQAFIFERYGPRLDVDQLADFFGVAKMYLDGKKRYADFRDLATHLDECRERAA